jgi:V-type H+-transporting ATPase subunit E
LSSLFNEAKNRLKEATANKDAYKKLLTELVLQGFYRLMESQVEITFKKGDEELVKAAVEQASKQYQETTKLTVKVNYSSGYLSDKMYVKQRL